MLGKEDRAKTHDLDVCYTNPNSRFFRPGIWKWRARDLVEAGEPLP